MSTTARTIAFVALASLALACSAEDSGQSPSTGTPGAAGAAARAGSTGAAGTGQAGSVGVGTAGAGASGCPLLRPVEDATCNQSTQICTYDEIDCQCPAGRWVCAEPVDPNCPPAMPVHDSACTVPDMTECEYLQDECECLAGRWACESYEEDGGAPTDPVEPPMTMSDAGMPPGQMPTAGGGSTRTLPCPDLRPIEGFSCEPAIRGCMYDTTHCVCPEGQWLCSERVDPSCPIEPPLEGSLCSGRADCDFFDIECECVRDQWSCKAND